MKHLDMRSAVIGAGLVLIGGGLASIGSSRQDGIGPEQDLSVRSLTVRSADGAPLISLRTEKGQPILELQDEQGNMLIRASSEKNVLRERGEKNTNSNGELVVRSNFPPLIDDIGFQCRLLSNGINLEELISDSGSSSWDEAVALRPGFLRFSDEASDRTFTLSAWGCYLFDASGIKRWNVDSDGAEYYDVKGRQRVKVISKEGSIVVVDESGSESVMGPARDR